MNRIMIAGVVVVALAVAGFLASPLFYDTKVDEALPTALNQMQEGLTLEKFRNMDDEPRSVLVDVMPDSVKAMIMGESAKTQTVVSEGMDDYDQPDIVKSGQFVGLENHSADGDAMILNVGDLQFLRFENFEVTNGPDLRVYLTQGGDVKNGIHLEKLKGSKGSQNYLVDGIDTDVYDTVVIYCQPFMVHFGKAVLMG